MGKGWLTVETPALEEVRRAIKAQDYARAKELLRPILKTQPSAEAWFLATYLTDDKEKKVDFARKALQLDPLHSGANRMLGPLKGEFTYTESTVERSERAQKLLEEATAHHTTARNVNQRIARRKRSRRALGCVTWFLVSSLCTATLVMNLIGVWTAPLGVVNQVSSGIAPVTQYEGVPLAQLEFPVNVVPITLDTPYDSSTGEPAVNVLSHGHAHAYTFQMYGGRAMAVIIGFITPNPRDFKRNVAMYDAQGNDITDSQCVQVDPPPEIYDQQPVFQTVAQYVSLLMLACPASMSGQYQVKIAGVEGESSGLYVFIVQDAGAF